MMTATAQNVVIGGGISGLTAARAIRQLGLPCVVLEKCPSLGGLTRTAEVGDFSFDYTGHLLHLSRYATPADVPYAGLNNDAWQRITRRSCCLIAGKIVDAPLQYHLGQLDPDILARCVQSYEVRPRLDDTEKATFRDFLIAGFGQYFADLFLIPQNEKTMVIPLDRLSKQAVRRFFPAPDDALVRAGIRREFAPSKEYNSSFWYPRSGGIGALVEGLRTGLDCARTNQEVKKLDLDKRTLETESGAVFAWEHLFSSIPLKPLCQLTTDPDLHVACRELSHSSTISFNIGLRGDLPDRLHGVHWVYVPDPSLPFYRVGFYSNISKGTCAPSHHSIYAEVGVPGEQFSHIEAIGTLQSRVISSLESLGWVDSRAIRCITIHVIQHAYIHYTDRRDSVVNSIISRLRDYDVHCVGRYGLWDYMSMEDSMESARCTVQGVFQ